MALDLTTDTMFKTTPYAHQRAALSAIGDHHAFALLAGIGTGKTKIALDWGAHLWRTNQIDAMVIVAPINVHTDVWQETQIPAHLPDDVPRRVRAMVQGKKLYGLEALLTTPPHVLGIACIYYDALAHESGRDAAATIIRHFKGRVLMVADESHRFRTPSAKRTRALWRLGELCSHRAIMSGTPMGKGYEDLYAQYRFLDWRILGFATNAEFKANHVIQIGQFKETVGYRDVEGMLAKMRPYSYRIRREDCLDLPERTFVRRIVDLSPEQRRAYVQMEQELMIELQNGVILTADHAVTRILRLQQIVAGHLPHGDGKGWTPLPCPRLHVAADVVEEADGPTIVWARFIPDRARLRETFRERGISVAVLGDDADALARFRSGDASALIANPASGGEGLTLNEASVMVHYSLSFKWIDLEQSEGRNFRSGQSKRTTVVTLHAKGTTDARVERTLRGRKDIHDELQGTDGLNGFLRPEA